MDAFELAHERESSAAPGLLGTRRASAAGLEHLYRRDGSRFLALAASIVGAQQASDVVQDAFARALRKRESWRGDGPLEAWLWRLVLHAARDAERRRVRRDRLALRLGHLRQAATSEAAALDDRLRGPIRRLPTRQRDCLILRYYGDLSYDDIGAVLGVASGTVGALLSKAHAALRTELEKEDPE